MKPLDAFALDNIIKPLRKSDVTIAAITKKLHAAGYTQKQGGRLCNATVSHFMIDNGMRTYSRKTPVRNKRVIANNSPSASKDDSDFMLEVLASNLSKSKKIKVLTALLED